MKRFIQGENRTQSILFPETVDDYAAILTRLELLMFLSMKST